MKTRTQKRMRLVAPARRKPQPKEKNIRPLVWALLAAFGMLMLSHILSGCTPIPAQAQAIPFPTHYPTPQPYTLPTQIPAPTRALPHPTATPSTRVSDVTIRAIVSTGYENGTVNLRACPSTACAVVEILQEGATLHLLGEGNAVEYNWLKVQTQTHTGYLYAKFAEVEK